MHNFNPQQPPSATPSPGRPNRVRAGVRDRYSGGTRPPKPPHAIRNGFLIFLGFVISGLAGTFAYFLPVAQTAVHDFGKSRAVSVKKNQITPPLPASGAPFTVLLMGSDNDAKFVPDHILTQSMILVRVDPATHSATMLSLPRDLWVPLASGGSAKIDAAYANGGAANAVATVEQDFNVHVDYWAWVGLEGLVNIVNQLNGVDMVAQLPVLDDFYPADLTGTNPYDIARVAVLPGPQYMTGVTALQYVRSRHGDILEDIARSQRQQELLLDLKQKAKTLSVADLPTLASALGTGFATDLSITQIGQMLPLASELSGSNIHTIVMNYAPYFTGEYIDSQDALAPNWPAIQALTAQYFPNT